MKTPKSNSRDHREFVSVGTPPHKLQRKASFKWHTKPAQANREDPFHPFEDSLLLKGHGLDWKNFEQKPDEPRFKYLQRRMLRVILLTYLKHYVKHHPNLDVMGWEALGEELHNVICEVIGDDAFVKWGERISQEDL